MYFYTLGRRNQDLTESSEYDPLTVGRFTENLLVSAFFAFSGRSPSTK